jgi:lysophospholipase L1-like esterase
MSAGRVVVLMAATFLLASALNARGLHKLADIQPAGDQRSIGLALSRPLAAVSGALGLDLPRQWLKDALGRSGDDSIDTTVVLPPPLPPPRRVGRPGGHRTTAPPRPAFSPAHKLRLWIAGDSLGIVPGQELLGIAQHLDVIEPVAGGVDGQVSTGLERPDIYNWFTEVAHVMATAHPQAVVFSFGANDNHSYMTGLPPGVAVDQFGSNAWIGQYRRRVEGIIEEVIRGGGKVFWLGAPITASPSQNRGYQLINSIVRRVIAKFPGRAYYIDAYSIMATPSGTYSPYLETASGQLVLMRASDGVHYSPAGGSRLAFHVLAAMQQAFDLTSWKHHRRRHAAAG